MVALPAAGKGAAAVAVALAITATAGPVALSKRPVAFALPASLPAAARPPNVAPVADRLALLRTSENASLAGTDFARAETLFNNRPHFSRALDPDMTTMVDNEFRVAGAARRRAPGRREDRARRVPRSALRPSRMTGRALRS